VTSLPLLRSGNPSHFQHQHINHSIHPQNHHNPPSKSPALLANTIHESNPLLRPPNMSTTDSPKKVSVLFVCLGNICRSTMAEGVFRNLTQFNDPSTAHPLISRIDSCGTGAYHAGDNPDPRTIAVLKSHGITDYKHKARKVRVPQDFEEFDYVLGMDGMNMQDLKSMARRKGVAGSEEGCHLSLFGDFGGKKGEEVEDPYYGGGKGFEIAFEQLERFGKGLLEIIEREAEEKKKSA
jgi:low molecular weight phosphotyrosine protein phosphatase